MLLTNYTGLSPRTRALSLCPPDFHIFIDFLFWWVLMEPGAQLTVSLEDH